MKKHISILSVCLLILCCGCSNMANQSDVASENNTVIEDTGKTHDDNLSNSVDVSSVKTEASTDVEQAELPEKVNLVMNELCGNTKFQIECIDFKQYKSVEGNKYTDTPADGSVYLVMFLNISNSGENDLYFSAESFFSTVDGTDLSHTFLVNDPEGYSSIFNSVPADTTTDGYIVWEVPADWKELTLHYTGWQDVLNTIIDGRFTPDDL